MPQQLTCIGVAKASLPIVAPRSPELGARSSKPELEAEPEPKSKYKPAGGSAMLAAFVKKHAPSEASKAAESSE